MWDEVSIQEGNIINPTIKVLYCAMYCLTKAYVYPAVLKFFHLIGIQPIETDQIISNVIGTLLLLRLIPIK